MWPLSSMETEDGALWEVGYKARMIGKTLCTSSKVQRDVRVLVPSSDPWPCSRSTQSPAAASVRVLKSPLLKHFHLFRRYLRQQFNSQKEG